MREILRRSITGAVYVVLLLSAIFLNSDAFDFLLMIFGLACLYEFKRIVHLKGYYIFIAYLILWWAFVYLVQDRAWTSVLLVPTLVVDILLIRYLFDKDRTLKSERNKFLTALFYIGGGCILLTIIPYIGDSFAQILIMGVFVLIWVNDTFAYLVGRSLGRNKLFPSVSPKKTVEGALGGFVFSLGTAYVLSFFESSISLLQWLFLAAIIVVMGILGDLIESKLKRSAGVKDSGAILPGHGGMLDRLDSLIFAAPFAYLILIVYSYVS